MSERVRTAVIWVLGLVLLLPGLGVAGWIVARHVNELRSFQPVEATIEAASVTDGPGRGANYYPAIAYTYAIHARNYRSTRLRNAYRKSDYKSGPQAIVESAGIKAHGVG